MFDLAAIDTKPLSEAGALLKIRALDGKFLLNSKGGAVSLIVKGPDSAEYTRLLRSQVKKRMARSGLPTDDESTQDDSEMIDLLVACTISWGGILSKEQEPIPFTPEVCRQLYEAFPVIRDQVDAFIANRVNFIPASSKP